MQRIVMKAQQQRRAVFQTRRSFAKLVNYETAQPPPEGSLSDCKLVFLIGLNDCLIRLLGHQDGKQQVLQPSDVGPCIHGLLRRY